MSDWVDYKQIKTTVSFQEVVKHYQLQFSTKGKELVGTCPLPDHAGDRNNKNAFHIALDKNCFNCLTHCGGGNIIEFVQLMEKFPNDKSGFRQAAIFLQENFLKGQPVKSRPKEKPKVENKPAGTEKTGNTPLTFSLEKRIKYDHPFLQETKQFPLEFTKKFGIGWCKAGLMAGRIVFPIHNANGELVAYAGRSLTEKDEVQRGKYLFPTGFNKALELWNFHRVASKKKLLREYGLILVEGFTDALRLIQHGFPNVVALMGWSLTEQQEKMILSHTDKVALFLDNDEAGQEATKKIHKRLIHQVFVKVVAYPAELPDKTQPEDFTKEELRNMLGCKTVTPEADDDSLPAT